MAIKHTNLNETGSMECLHTMLIVARLIRNFIVKSVRVADAAFHAKILQQRRHLISNTASRYYIVNRQKTHQNVSSYLLHKTVDSDKI